MTDVLDHATTRAGSRLTVTSSTSLVVATLNRPAARNAIDLALVTELHELCADLEARPRILIVTGAEGFFAAGADIRELVERGRKQALDGINSSVFDRVAALPMPVLAAVDGPAIGGGAELAYACDLRIASTTATFGQPEVKLGILAAAGGAWRLRDLVGLSLAREMLYTGRTLKADEAHAAGLVTQVVEPGQALDAARSLAARMAGAAPLALRLTKLALRAPSAAHPLVDNIAQAVLFETEEKTQRMTAFLERTR